MNIVGKKILKHITDKGWSVPTTSKRSGVPVPTIKNIIYGSSLTHKAETLEKLANAFGCKIEDLKDYSKAAGNTSKKGNQDFEILEECFAAIKSFVSRRSRSYDSKQLMKAVDNLSSFVIKKRAAHPSYQIGDDIIEYILDNLSF